MILYIDSYSSPRSGPIQLEANQILPIWYIIIRTTMAFGDDQTSSDLYILLTSIFLVSYLILTAFLEKNQFPVHRTAVAIIVGIIAGGIIYFSSKSTYQKITKIDQMIIFNVLFPPMIFAQGYTLHKSVFLKNVRYILVFGLLGTFLSFLVSWALFYLANQWEVVRDSGDMDNFRTLSDIEILLVAACLCSIDTTAAEETVCEHRYPRLYSVIFGQDLLKDTVTIILFDSINKLGDAAQTSHTQLVVYWYTFFQMLGNFLQVIAGSVAAGFLSAFIVTYLSKKMRFMALDKGVSETGFLFLIGFFTYIYTEMLGFSGSISLLLYGIFLNHYNIYNMSEQSRHASVSTFTLISNLCEGALFLIMGILVWQGQWQSPSSQTDKMTHSYLFFFVAMVIVCIARFVNIYGLGWLAARIGKRKFTFTFQEMHILFFGGLVRGAVPFVLFSSVSFVGESAYIKNEGLVLKTTIMFIIIFTSLFLNSLIPCLYKRRYKALRREYLRIFGPLQVQAKKEMKQPSKFKLFEQKYVKRVLIVDYQARKEQIHQEKKMKNSAIIAEIMAEDQDEELLSEDGRSQLLLN